MYIPCKPQFYYIKVGFKGVKIIYACFRDGLNLSENNYTIKYIHLHIISID